MTEPLPEDVKDKLAQATATFVSKTGVSIDVATTFAARIGMIIADYHRDIVEEAMEEAYEKVRHQ